MPSNAEHRMALLRMMWRTNALLHAVNQVDGIVQSEHLVHIFARVEQMAPAVGQTGLARAFHNGLKKRLIGAQGFPAPLSSTALPLFRQSELICTSASGRLSKITPIRRWGRWCGTGATLRRFRWRTGRG
jgi:hypothetical protein